VENPLRISIGWVELKEIMTTEFAMRWWWKDLTHS